LEPVYIKLYEDSFSQAEIDGLAAFYRSPTGKAVVLKVALVMQNLMTLVQQRMARLIPKIQQMAQETASQIKARRPRTGRPADLWGHLLLFQRSCELESLVNFAGAAMQRPTFTGTFIVLALSCAAPLTQGVAAQTAKASVTVDGQTFTFSGGSCVKNEGGLTINIGVPAMQAPAGTHPDYFGVSIPHVPGSFKDAVVTFTKDGKRYSVIHVVGDASDSGATFSGTLLRGGGPVKGSFTC